MKKWKRILILLLAVGLMGCVSKNDNGKILDQSDLSSLAEELTQSKLYSYELSSPFTEDSFSRFFHSVPEGVKGYFYTSTTSSAELMAVMLLEEEADAQKMVKTLNSYMDDSYEEFVKYNPEEAQKLQNRMVEQYGNLVVAVVCAEPEEAKKILLDYIEEK